MLSFISNVRKTRMSELCIYGTFAVLQFPKSFQLSIFIKNPLRFAPDCLLKQVLYLEIKTVLAADTVQTSLDGGVGVRLPQMPGVSGTGSSAEQIANLRCRLINVSSDF